MFLADKLNQITQLTFSLQAQFAIGARFVLIRAAAGSRRDRTRQMTMEIGRVDSMLAQRAPVRRGRFDPVEFGAKRLK
jgi:hypothetical protein